MLKHFFPDVTEEACSIFSSLVPDNSMSMAELQGMFLLHKDDLDSLVNAVNDLNLNKINDSEGWKVKTENIHRWPKERKLQFYFVFEKFYTLIYYWIQIVIWYFFLFSCYKLYWPIYFKEEAFNI